MEKNDINIPRFIRSIRYALEDLAREAHCYGWRDDPQYLAIKRYLENQIGQIGTEPTPLTKSEALELPAGAHIWIRQKCTYTFPGDPETHWHYNYYPALVDYTEDDRLVAIWNATTLDDLLHEKNYGEIWWAYLYDPTEKAT